MLVAPQTNKQTQTLTPKLNLDVEIGSLAAAPTGANHHVLSSSDAAEHVNVATKRDKFYAIVNYLRVSGQLAAWQLELTTG